MDTRKIRTERGETTVSVLVGMFVGSLIIGGLMLFYFSANDASQVNVTRADQEADAVKVLNRAGRDIAEAARVDATSTHQRVTVHQERVDESTGKTVRSQVRYEVVEDTANPGKQMLVREVDADNDGTFEGRSVLGRNLVPSVNAEDENGTKFEYKKADGSRTNGAPQDAGLVDITYVARTKKGTVRLESAASLDTAAGAKTEGAPLTGPDAVDDTRTGVIAGRSLTINVLENDEYEGKTDTPPAVPEVSFTGAPAGATVAGGTVTLSPAAGTTQFTYELTDDTGLSDVATVTVSAIQPEVKAYPDADQAPESNTDTTGENIIEWTGGPLTYTRISGPADGNPVTGTLSVAMTGTHRHTVGYGTVYKYEIVDMEVADDATQFPAPQRIFAQGSDTDGNGTVDAAGYNQVRLGGAVNLPSGSIQEVRVYKSALGPSYKPVIDTANFSTVSNPAFTASCAGVSGGTGNCWRHSVGRGTERVYVPVSYTPADADAAQNPALNAHAVVKGGKKYLPSFSLEQAGAEARALYTSTSNDSARAYQAPASGHAIVEGGTPNAGQCYSSDGVRLTGSQTGGTSNGAYHCADGTGLLTYRALGDAGDRDSGTHAFCEYDGDPGECSVTINGGRRGTYEAQISTSTSETNTRIVAQTSFGASDTYSIRVCNAGGCANAASTTMDAFVAPFQVKGVSQNPGARFKNIRMWTNDTTPDGCNAWTQHGCGEFSADVMSAQWSQPAGIFNGGRGDQFEWTVRRVGGLGGAKSWTGTSKPAQSNDTGDLNVDASTLYEISVVARPGHNPNMWRRSAENSASETPSDGQFSGKAGVTAFSSPPPVAFVQDAPFCTPNVDDAWRFGYVFRNNVVDQDGNWANTGSHKTRYMWWVGTVFRSKFNEVGQRANYRWRGGTKSANAAGGWNSAPYWDVTTASARGTEYYANLDAGATDGEYVSALAGSASDRTVPANRTKSGNVHSGVGHLRVETYVQRGSVGNPDFGDLTYWDGGGGWGTYTGNLAGVGQEIRHRSGDISASSNAACSGNGTSGNQWKGNKSWSVVDNGGTMTRRTHAKVTGVNYSSANPNATGGRRFSGAY